MSDVRVRGALVLSQRGILARLAGEDAVARAVNELPPPLREPYANATVLSWVPQPAVREVTARVAAAMSVSPVGLAEQVVAESVEAACAGPWSVFLRMTSNKALLARAAAIFGRAFDVGDFDARTRMATDVTTTFEVTLRGWPEADEMDLASVAAGIGATLRAVRRRAHVQYSRTPDGAVFVVVAHDR